MYTIFIPTDFSDAARNAVGHAVTHFGKENRFVLYHAFGEIKSGAGSMISINDILREAAENDMKEKVDWFKEQYGVRPDLVDMVLEQGEVVESITRAARKLEASIVVLGTTGATGLKEIIYGSVASGVLKRCDVPVMAIPLHYKPVPIKNIVFAADLQRDDDDRLPDVFLHIARKYNSTVKIVTVVKPGKAITLDEAEEGYDLHRMMGDIPHSFDCVENEDVEEGLRSYLIGKEAQLVVVKPHRESWLRELFSPSISKSLAQHLTIPVMSIPEQSPA
ncbi:MAG: universal stress protein [Salibacteraceae bacterium]